MKIIIVLLATVLLTGCMCVEDYEAKSFCNARGERLDYNVIDNFRCIDDTGELHRYACGSVKKYTETRCYKWDCSMTYTPLEESCGSKENVTS